MNVLQAIQYIIQGWKEVTAETICNCWHHTKILLDDVDDTDNDDVVEPDVEPDAELDVEPNNDLVFNEIFRMLEILNLPNSMNAKEFLNIFEENIVCEISKDDQIITELVEIFKKKSDDDLDEDEIDDSVEIKTIGANVALKSLKTVNTFLL